MQKVCRAEGGVKSYLADSRCLLTEENRRCPFCPDRHRLRLHGKYARQALFPGEKTATHLEVHRLLCVRTSRTLSLLPDFCLPRRQHGPSILGLFLHAVVCGHDQLQALVHARPDATQHSTACTLLKGFLGNAAKIRTYLAGFRERMVDPPRALRARGDLALLVLGLVKGFEDPAAAFIYHARRFHNRFGLGLA